MSHKKTSAKMPPEEDRTNERLDEGSNLDLKASKFKKRDVDIQLAIADIKLAERLDSCLNLGATRKPRFFMNKPNTADGKLTQVGSRECKLIDMGSIKPKNLSREELRERLAKKYDTLVPELDPERVEVKLVKVLSVKESLEMGIEEAKRQLVDQMKLNSVSGNQQAYLSGTESFKFNDGYEMSGRNLYAKNFAAFRRTKTESTNNLTSDVPKLDKSDRTTSNNSTAEYKSVKFADEVNLNDTHKKEFSPYDFITPDEDDVLTDDEEREQQLQKRELCNAEREHKINLSNLKCNKRKDYR